MRTPHTNNTTSKALGSQASDAIKRLGGNPDNYRVPKRPHSTDHLESTNTNESTALPAATRDHGIHSEPPAWLHSLISGKVDIEDIADELATCIREDPRFIQRTWWQTFLDCLVAIVPSRLIAMAERLTDSRECLRKQEE
jgi:hypothetical protein